ncbi:MAG TPA: DUF2490 domain-containing protein [Pyrinomonadaceae bacterium]|nr:DUF2490 domain-containing protein [Pyrinomonadaceae bacterium]
MVRVLKNLRQLWPSLSLVFLLTLATPASSQTALDQTDTQQWNDVIFSLPISKQVDFNMFGTLRFGRDISRPVDERFGVGATWRIGQLLSLVPAYLHIETQPFEGRKLHEDRLNIAAILRFEAHRFRFSDRNLVERRFRSPGIVSTRYRNRLQVEHPVGPDKIKLSLFASDEVFYDWSVDDWVRNRFAAGIIKPLNKNITLEVYYLRQNDGRSLPGDLHAIGTTWRIKL